MSEQPSWSESSLLNQLPSELFHMIINMMLEGPDVHALYMTMNHTISHRIEQSLTHLHLDINQHYEEETQTIFAPALVARLKRLRHLSLDWYRFSRTWQSKRNWNLFLSSPMLESLELHCDGVSIGNIELPKSIKDLRICADHVDYEFIAAHLPQLSSLKLQTRDGLPYSMFNSRRALWHDQMTTLEVSTLKNYDDNDQPWFAQTSLQRIIVHSCTMLDDANLLVLPPQLTELRLHEARHITSRLFASLPAQLEILEMTLMGEKIDKHHLAQLPSSLTCLILQTAYKDEQDIGRVDTTRINDNPLLSLPRQLKHLALMDQHVYVDQDLSALPPKLEHLELSESCALTSFCFKQLPRLLKSIIFHQSEKKTIMPNLTILSDDHVSDLPPSLTTLMADKFVVVSPEQIRRLPRSITQLSLEATKFTTEHLCQCPNLRRLWMHPQSACLLLLDQLPKIIPKTMDVLKILNRHLPHLLLINNCWMPERYDLIDAFSHQVMDGILSLDPCKR